MFSTKVAAPFVLLSIIFMYLTWEHGSSWTPYLVGCVVISAAIYTLSPQIDWWYAKRNPPNLPQKLGELVGRFCPFYQRLDLDGKKRFQSRVAMFMMGTDWTPQGWDDVPKDVQAALATYGVQLNFKTDDLVFEKFEKIVVYPHPFPSPNYPVWHHSELFEPDGCLLFSAEQVMQGFGDPMRFYQIGLHEYAKVYILAHPEKHWPSVDDSFIPSLEKISGQSHEHVKAMIGIPLDSLMPVAVHHFFTFPEQFQAVLPKLAVDLEHCFEKGSLQKRVANRAV